MVCYFIAITIPPGALETRETNSVYRNTAISNLSKKGRGISPVLLLLVNYTVYGETLKTEYTRLVGIVTFASSAVTNNPKSVRVVSLLISASSRLPEFIT